MARGPHPTTFLPLAAGYAPLVGHHRHLLDDRVRTNAFLRAIARVVRNGDRVADLGCGTGILAIAARRAGAAAVWAIDRDPIVHVAEAIARANGVDRITFVEGHSKDVELPAPIDVLISECFGPLAVGGTMIRAFTELRARALAPEGRVIPRSVALYVAPVEAPAIFEHVAAFTGTRYGIRWSAAQALATHNLYNAVVEPEALLATGAPVLAIDLARDAWTGDFAATVEFSPRAGRIHGFCGWFVAELGGGITLSTAPDKPPTIWRQVFLPLPRGLAVTRKTAITLALRGHGGEHFDWSGTIGKSRFKCSTRYSYPAALIDAVPDPSEGPDR